jgi:hypothetical protein
LIRNLNLSLFLVFIRLGTSCALGADSSGGLSPSEQDAGYFERFHEAFPPLENPPSLEEYATAERFDQLYLGEALDNSLLNVTNDAGGIAWGLAYTMISLNEMYRGASQEKYLDANLRCIQAVMEARDDKVGKKLWTGTIAPAWGCDKYAKRGRAVFAVHTGMIVYPMVDFLDLTRDLSQFDAHRSSILASATEALAFHDRQWRNGPGEGEGHYIALDQEDGLDGKVLPGNRLSSMGRAHWVCWKVTGQTAHRDRALGIARYIKNRLTPSPDGAYYWSYWLPENPVTAPATRESVEGEDTSHGGLTASLPILLSREEAVFGKEDRRRFAQTVLQGFGRLGDGVLMGDVTGNPASSPNYVWGTARWLELSDADPEVAERILPFFPKYVATPYPLDLAFLIGRLKERR